MITRRSISTMIAGLAACVLTATPGAAADKVKFGMLRVPQVLLVGIDKGFFKQEGIDVEPVFFRSGAELVPSLSTGQIDIAATAAGAALYNAMARGVKAILVADYWVPGPHQPGGDPNAIAVRKDLIDSGAVKSAKDLKGKTIATKTGTSVDFAFKQYVLPRHGLQIKDMKWLSVNTTQRVATIVAGQAQGAIIGDPQAEIAVQKGLVRRLEDFCAYDKTRMMHIANPKTYKEHPELYEKYFRGWLKAHQLLQQNPEEFAKVYTKWLNEVGDKTSYEIILPVVKRIKSQPFITAEVTSYLNDMANKQEKLGWIKSHPDFSKLTLINDKSLRMAAKEMGIDVRTAEAK